MPELVMAANALEHSPPNKVITFAINKGGGDNDVRYGYMLFTIKIAEIATTALHRCGRWSENFSCACRHIWSRVWTDQLAPQRKMGGPPYEDRPSFVACSSN
ncbi:hypothetical protein GCM10010401_01380 [Rarobacter faecitabidus]